MKTKKILLSNLTNSKLPDDQLSRLFVGNLNTSQISKKHVLKLFGKFGQIKAISMHRGYAFVQFFYKEHAASAIRKMHGQLVGGQVIDVNLVTEPKPYQKKKLTFTEHSKRATKSVESKSLLESTKRSNESTVSDSPRKCFKRESSPPRSSRLSSSALTRRSASSRLPNESQPSRDKSHSPSYSIHSSATLVTSSVERTSSASSTGSAHLHNSTNQTSKPVRLSVGQQPAAKLPYPASSYLNSYVNSPYLNSPYLNSPYLNSSYLTSPYPNSFEALMSSIYLQHARSSQSSHRPSNQPNVQPQTSGQQASAYDLVVCGNCKRVFYSFSIFLQHKQAMCLPNADLCTTSAR